MLEVHGRLYQLWRGMVSVYNNPSLNLATGVAYMDGRTDDVRRPAAGEGRGAARGVAYSGRPSHNPA